MEKAHVVTFDSMGSSPFLEVDDFVGYFNLLIQRLHVGELDVFTFVHTVDDHTLPSGCKQPIAESK